MNVSQRVKLWMRRVLNAIGYEGATSGRRGYTTAAGSADEITRQGLQYLRDRSRHMVRNHWAAKHAVDVVTSHVVGPGILPSCRDDADFDALLDLWANHKSQVGSQRGQSLGAIQRLTCRTVIESGSAIVVRQWRTPKQMQARKLVLPFQVQVLEPEYLDNTRDGKIGENVIHNGIEYDATDWPVAYWLHVEHPGSNYRSNGKPSLRVPASDVAHVFWQQRAGQTIGVPWMHAVLVKLKDFDDYEDAQLLRQKIAAMFAAFVSNPTGNPGREVSDDPISLEPGLIQFLNPGEQIDFASPPAVTGYNDFSHVTLRSIAAGIGLAYEDMTGDYSQVNFSSARMAKLVSEELIEQWRHEMMIGNLCQSLDDWAHEGAALRGIRSEHECAWTAPGRKLLDPSREVGAIVTAIDNGLTSRSAEIRKMGRDIEDVDAERAKDRAREEMLSLGAPAAPPAEPAVTQAYIEDTLQNLRLQ